MSIYTSLLTAGTNNHEETSENANAFATDFVSEGVIGAITNTSGVAPATGAFAVNAQGTPDMTVAVSSGVAYVTATPSSQNSQTLRVRNTATANVTISSNSSGSTKYDWVYIKVDGTKAANPALNADDVATLVTSRSSSYSSDDGTPPTYGYPIAVVTVANGASSITNGNISDVRTIAPSVQANSVSASAIAAGAVTASKLGDSGWLTLALPAGASGTHRYRKICNRVQVEVSLTGISVANNAGQALTVLPSGYRPNNLCPVSVLFGGSAVGVGFITSAGLSTLTNRSGSTATSVDAMATFLVD